VYRVTNEEIGQNFVQHHPDGIPKTGIVQNLIAKHVSKKINLPICGSCPNFRQKIKAVPLWTGEQSNFNRNQNVIAFPRYFIAD
jgi:hypothetical protein